MIWGGGLLAEWGVRDFAGGIVVHDIAGLGGARLGALRGQAASSPTRRTASRSSRSARASLVRLVRLQRRQRVEVDDITALAFLNTDIAASFAAITWLFVEWKNAKNRSSSGS